MYGRLIRSFSIHKSTHEFTSTRFNHKKPNFIDNIRESASGLPPEPAPASESSSSYGGDDRVNVVKTSTTPSSLTSDSREKNAGDGDMAEFVAETAKEGVVKAMETGLGIGEMGKKTLDNVWDAAKDTTQVVKEAVAGDDGKKNGGPANDQFVNGARKRAGWYDLERNK